MKKQIIVLAAVFVIALAVLTNVPTASARAVWQDPQLCVSGELLSVVPDADVYVKVPTGTQVSTAVETCGGDPTQPVIPMNNVTFKSDLNGNMVVSAQNVAEGTKVIFAYNGVEQKEKANDSGVATVRFDLP